MKKLFCILVLFTAAACSKVANKQTNPDPPVPFFKSPGQVVALVKKALSRFHLEGELLSVDRITYLHSGKTDFALIFYTSSKGAKNLVVKKELTENLLDESFSTSVCTGSDCDCKVKVLFGNDGTIDVRCSCDTCKMVTGNLSDDQEDVN